MPNDDPRLSSPDTQAGKLQRLVLAKTREHEATEGGLPTSLRFIYYELKDQLPAKPFGAKRLWSQDLSDAAMVLRRAGIVPWTWYSDETRELKTWSTAPSVYAYMLDAVDGARIDPWRGRAPMIITESRSLAGVLEAIAYAYAVPIIGTGGQVGGVLHTDVSPALVAEQDVVYLGDLNNAGADIEANTRRELEYDIGPLAWERLLLTREQVATYALPPKETVDHRFRNGGRRSDSWEAEALGQGRIQQMLRDWLDARLPEPLADVHVREEVEREQERRRLRRRR